MQHSILFPWVKVDNEPVVEDAILMQNVVIGERCKVRNCIIDKDVVVPPGETIGYDKERDSARFTLSEQGIVVVPQGYRFSS